MIQNWNNIVSYIKYTQGVPYNLLEISDDDIIKFLQDQVLPEFTQYCPAKLWIKIYETDKVLIPNTFHDHTYNLNISDDIYIASIENVYWNSHSSGIEESVQGLNLYTDPTDIVLSSGYAALAESLQIVNSFEYIPPRTVMFSTSIGSGVIAEINTIHQTLQTIQPDLYNSVFKKMCASEVCKYLANIRSKFSNITTPFGEVALNVEQLRSTAQTLDTEIQDKLNLIPPNQLLAWF